MKFTLLKSGRRAHETAVQTILRGSAASRRHYEIADGSAAEKHYSANEDDDSHESNDRKISR
jgi:hypothetical protein